MLASGICERTRVTSYHQGLLLDYVDAKAVFHHACKLGLEGIVSKRLGSRNQSGRLPHEGHHVGHCSATTPNVGGILKMRGDKLIPAHHSRDFRWQLSVRRCPMLRYLRHAEAVAIMMLLVFGQIIPHIGGCGYRSMSKDKDLGFQRSPRPDLSDQRAPDQPAKIAHRQRVSADSRPGSAVFSLR